MDGHCRKGSGRLANVNILEEKLAEEWRKIQQDWLLGLLKGMGKHLEYVIAVNDATTLY